MTRSPFPERHIRNLYKYSKLLGYRSLKKNIVPNGVHVLVQETPPMSL